MRRGGDPQVDRAEFLAGVGVNHSIVVCRRFVNRVWRESDQLELKLAVAEVLDQASR
ncbi:MAG TPA: hypothetical protein VGF59_21480 [Bryobacteraceae bacterium]|jgi:hypothetical protein